MAAGRPGGRRSPGIHIGARTTVSPTFRFTSSDVRAVEVSARHFCGRSNDTPCETHFTRSSSSRSLTTPRAPRDQGRLDGSPTDVLAMEKLLKPFVLFVCRHNTGRSQMAEAYLRHFAGDAVEVASAGTIAADVPDPGVVAAMAEDGIDISGARPKLIDPAVAAHADRIITMGCDVEGVPNIDADWDVDDPKGAPPETLRAIRDQVKSKARELAESLRV